MKILKSLLVNVFLLWVVVLGSVNVNASEFDESKQLLIPIGVGDITIFIPVVSGVTQVTASEASNIDNGYDLSWSAVSGADYYEVIITDENGKKTVVRVTELQLSYAGFPLGNSQVSIRACNASDQCGLPTVLLDSVTVTEQITYQHTDFLGSPTVETDSAATVVSRSHYEPFGKRLEGNKEGIGYTGHLEDAELELTYMQARYYDPVIGRFYSNDPVDAMGHIDRSNPVHGFNRYAYANNNPYKYVDPDGEFGIIGALIGAAIDAGTQIATGIASGQSLGEAASNLDYGSIATSAALGAVGGHATQLLKGAVTGSMKVGKTVVALTSKAERVVAGVNGAAKAGVVGAIQSGRKGGDPVKAAGIKVVNSITSPIPVGTIIDKGLDYVGSQPQKQQDPEKSEEK